MENTYRIDTINKQLILSFDFKDTLIVDYIKKVSYSARYNPILKIWIIPVDIYSKSRIYPFLKEWKFKYKTEKSKTLEKFNYSVSKSRMLDLAKTIGRIAQHFSLP